MCGQLHTHTASSLIRGQNHHTHHRASLKAWCSHHKPWNGRTKKCTPRAPTVRYFFVRLHALSRQVENWREQTHEQSVRTCVFVFAYLMCASHAVHAHRLTTSATCCCVVQHHTHTHTRELNNNICTIHVRGFYACGVCASIFGCTHAHQNTPQYKYLPNMSHNIRRLCTVIGFVS